MCSGQPAADGAAGEQNAVPREPSSPGLEGKAAAVGTPPPGCGGRAFASRGFGGGWRGPRPHAPVPASGELKAHGCFKSLLRPLPTRSCPRREAQGCVSGTGPGGRSGQVTHAPRAPLGGQLGENSGPRLTCSLCHSRPPGQLRTRGSRRCGGQERGPGRVALQTPGAGPSAVPGRSVSGRRGHAGPPGTAQRGLPPKH